MVALSSRLLVFSYGNPGVAIVGLIALILWTRFFEEKFGLNLSYRGIWLFLLAYERQVNIFIQSKG